MTDLLLAIVLIALFAYGYWVMARLDRFIHQTNGRQTVRGGRRDSFQKVFRLSPKR